MWFNPLSGLIYLNVVLRPLYLENCLLQLQQIGDVHDPVDASTPGVKTAPRVLVGLHGSIGSQSAGESHVH